METIKNTGGAVKNAMRSLSIQFMAFSEPQALNHAVRKIAVASVLIASAVAAQAQQSQRNGVLLPEQSAGRWGSVVGGAVLGSVASTATGDRLLNQVLTGVATEVGRNGGRIVATAPYDGASSTSRSPTNYSGGFYSNYRPIDPRQADQIDTLALRTAFAYEEYVKVMPKDGRMVTSSFHQAALNPLISQRNQFEMAYRTARSNGYDVSPWNQIATTFRAPVGTITLSQISSETAPIAERLYRPGGPGFSQQQRVENMDSLRQKMEILRQQQAAGQQNHSQVSSSNPFSQVQ